ncbi:MAG: hypothetical protein AAB649_05850, partial [Patescibacteria group bacterium]
IWQLNNGSNGMVQRNRFIIAPLRFNGDGLEATGLSIPQDVYVVSVNVRDTHGDRVIDGTRVRVSVGAPPTPQVSIQTVELRNAAGQSVGVVTQGKEKGFTIHTTIKTSVTETLYSIKLVSQENKAKRLLIDLGTLQGSGVLEKAIALSSLANLLPGVYDLITEMAIMDTAGNTAAQASRRISVKIAN